MPDDDCKWGVMPFTDRQQKTRYALGLFLHPFGVEKPLLIGQLSSDVAEVFVPFLRSRALSYHWRVFPRLQFVQPHMHRCTLFFIFMDLWK